MHSKNFFKTSFFFFLNCSSSQLQGLTPQGLQTVSVLSRLPRQRTPTPPAAACPKSLQAAGISVLGPPARGTAVTPCSLSCSSHGRSRAWLARERVLPELNRDEGAKSGWVSPSPSVPPSVFLAWQSPADLRLFLDLTEAFQITCLWFCLGSTGDSFRKRLETNGCLGPTRDY